MNYNDYKIINAYPLELKIEKTKLRIKEMVNIYGEDGLYISFSGGKDSCVLTHLIREVCGYNIKCVFCNTGLEYPEVVNHVKTFNNLDIIKPKLTFREVIEKYGYPVVSKEQSNYIYRVRNTKSEGEFNKYFHGINRDGSKTQFKVADKHRYLINSPFKISDKCCDKLKKDPFKKYEKETGKIPILGVLASESRQRLRMYLKDGCNALNNKRVKSTPLGFWNEQDILEYIYKYNIKIPSVYGDVKFNGDYYLTGEQRTGCIFCMYGLESENNRFQRLKKTHPKLYNYCINKLKIGEVLEFMGISY